MSKKIFGLTKREHGLERPSSRPFMTMTQTPLLKYQGILSQERVLAISSSSHSVPGWKE